MLSGMLDVLVARTAGPEEELRGWASQHRMAVVNAMSAEEHPTQALTDLTTLLRHFGRIEGLRVLYAGEGNNTAAALALALSRYPGVHLDLRTPPGYGLTASVAARAAAHAVRSGARITERHDMAALAGSTTSSTPPAGRPPAPASRTRTGGRSSRRSRSARGYGTARPAPSSCTTCRPTAARRSRRTSWTARRASPSRRPPTRCTAPWRSWSTHAPR